MKTVTAARRLARSVPPERIIWFPRGHYPTQVGFCPGEEAWNREMRRLGLSDAYPMSAARSNWFEESESVIVTVHERNDSLDSIAVAALIVHEAVHVWQKIQRHIGQCERPGDEIEAYAVQQLTAYLLDAYASTRRTTCCA